MVNEITHTIDGIKPGAVGVLIFQDEVQIPLGDSPVIVVGKDHGSAGQQEGAVSSSINNSPLTEGV